MIGSAYSEVSEVLASEGDKRLDEMVEGIPDKDELLLDASYALDERVIVAALRAGAEPNARSKSIGGQGSETPLHRAVRGHGDGSFERVAKILIDAGADVRARNAAKDTPLHSALYESERRAIVLIGLGMDPSVLDDASQPMLVKAILLNMMDLAEVLLDRGVPIDVRDEQGQSALLVATKEGRIPAVRFLLERGADPNAPDRKQMTPKRVALESGDRQLETLFNPPNTAAVQINQEKQKSGCAIGSAALLALALLPFLVLAVRS
jgi:ankyrin repeat protein